MCQTSASWCRVLSSFIQMPSVSREFFTSFFLIELKLSG